MGLGATFTNNNENKKHEKRNNEKRKVEKRKADDDAMKMIVALGKRAAIQKNATCPSWGLNHCVCTTQGPLLEEPRISKMEIPDSNGGALSQNGYG